MLSLDMLAIPLLAGFLGENVGQECEMALCWLDAMSCIAIDKSPSLRFGVIWSPVSRQHILVGRTVDGEVCAVGSLRTVDSTVVIRISLGCGSQQGAFRRRKLVHGIQSSSSAANLVGYLKLGRLNQA
ncbi:hypothetical protein F4778DRAFT_262592 [Xylariomycetidae sp. FL2044]|nr:hypothetical protein F4778DRAFT_262592 [Xylariomycetidae sp. FL2044]